MLIQGILFLLHFFNWFSKTDTSYCDYIIMCAKCLIFKYQNKDTTLGTNWNRSRPNGTNQGHGKITDSKCTKKWSFLSHLVPIWCNFVTIRLSCIKNNFCPVDLLVGLLRSASNICLNVTLFEVGLDKLATRANIELCFVQ